MIPKAASLQCPSTTVTGPLLVIIFADPSSRTSFCAPHHVRASNTPFPTESNDTARRLPRPVGSSAGSLSAPSVFGASLEVVAVIVPSKAGGRTRSAPALLVFPS